MLTAQITKTAMTAGQRSKSSSRRNPPGKRSEEPRRTFALTYPPRLPIAQIRKIAPVNPDSK